MLKKEARVAVLIACHNEEETIASSIYSLLKQTKRPAQIIGIDDASTDGTFQILKNLPKKIPSLSVYACTKKRFRAGALNFGLKFIKRSVEYVLTMDADTTLDNHVIEQGLKYFEKYPDLGGVCSRAGLKTGRGILYRLQRLEYSAGFDAERTATFENVMVLHGMCTLFKKDALLQIGGFTEGHLIEDYDVTVKLKKHGFSAMYNPRMVAYTSPPASLHSLIKQRLRWSRGGIDIIFQHGVNTHTLEDIVDHVLFLLLFFLILFIMISSFLSIVIWHYQPHPLALLLGLITYVIHLYRLKFVPNKDWKDIIIRITVLPELFLSMLYSGIQLWAYALTLTSTRKRW